MDKNTIVGFVLIALILGAMTWFSKPTEEQQQARKRYEDSIAREQLVNQMVAEAAGDRNNKFSSKNIQQELDTISSDSLKQDKLNGMFGAFAASALGEDKIISLESDVLSLGVNTRGGYISSANLKKYRTHDSLPLYLFDKDESLFNMVYYTSDNRIINTAEMYFEALPVREDAGKKELTMRLKAGGDSYIDHIYTLTEGDYMVGFRIHPNKMRTVLSPTMNVLDMSWDAKLRQQEKGRKFEERYTGLYYKFSAESGVEHLSESSDDSEDLRNKVRWVAFKDQFFSSVLIADDDFLSASVSSKMITKTTSPYLKDFSTQMVIGFNPAGDEPINFRYYLGPNHYPTLRSYDKGVDKEDRLEIQRLVPLGASVFRWVNQILVIPLFNFLDNYISNFGIIILIMTLVIKLILFPMTYKSYMSSAKMRVLKPQVEEINQKYAGDDKAMQRQQAVMELYNRVGVSPMSGCLPMLLQMPILIALFMFFPSAIELRQESFLWAKDLSTYDAVLTWDTQIPLISTFYGNHVSLFCLLMTIVNIVYTRFNMQMTNTGQEQMPGMKWMMYLMPLMFLFFFNHYSSGLSYYYLLSTLISIIQTVAIRYFINEDKLLAQLEANKKKPVKKSGFMARLADAQKQQQAELKKQQAERAKKKK